MVVYKYFRKLFLQQRIYKNKKIKYITCTCIYDTAILGPKSNFWQNITRLILDCTVYTVNKNTYHNKNIHHFWNNMF